MKRLKEIVGLLEQIVPLVIGGQDGGPGSGIKGHRTGRQHEKHSQLVAPIAERMLKVLQKNREKSIKEPTWYNNEYRKALRENDKKNNM